MQQSKPIAKHEGIISEELLPYPIVYYPDFYGTFFAFKKSKGTSLTLCSCMRAAIINYLSVALMEIEFSFVIEQLRTDGINIYPKGKLSLDSTFPLALRGKFSRRGCTPTEIIDRLNFQPKLCHECNVATPTYFYCHEIYGSSFKQNYGWYINKLSLDYGVYSGHVYLPELCPQEILDLVEIPYVIDGVVNRNFRHWKNTNKIAEQRSRIQRGVESIVRQKFGHKQIGDAWTNETILYNIVRTLFPSLTVVRHYRPRFLQGLELDIYLPQIKLGIEYQGIQHYQSIDHWGGEDALSRLQERDLKKKHLCRGNKVKLVYFDYTEGLSNRFVAEKLRHYL